MKKLFLLAIFLTLILTACGGVKATVPDNNYAKESKAIVDKWITAFNNSDTEGLISLYADDIDLSICDSSTCEHASLAEAKYIIPIDLPTQKFKVQSYFTTSYGEYAVLNGIYSRTNKPGSPYTPATVILKIYEDKITAETWYYDTSID
jgi:hypothetical protein